MQVNDEATNTCPETMKPCGHECFTDWCKVAADIRESIGETNADN